VSGCGLEDRVIGVRSPAEAKGFSSSLCVQTGSGANPTSSTTSTGGPFHRAKVRTGSDADNSPHLVPRFKICTSYTSSPPKRLRGVLWGIFIFKWDMTSYIDRRKYEHKKGEKMGRQRISNLDFFERLYMKIQSTKRFYKLIHKSIVFLNTYLVPSPPNPSFQIIFCGRNHCLSTSSSLFLQGLNADAVSLSILFWNRKTRNTYFVLCFMW
jgi:hypothetical protein